MTYTIRVNLAQRGDWFLATSPDLSGLFVADADLGAVETEVPEAIKLLFKVQRSMEVVVRKSAAPEKRSLEEIVYMADAA